jgi:Bacterial PH domain
VTGSSPGREDGSQLKVRPEAIRPWCAAVVALVLAAMVTAALLLGSSGNGIRLGGLDQASIVGLGVLLAALCWRLTSPRVQADTHGVRTKGMLGDYRTVPWEVVESVEFRPKWRWARLVLAGDETISLYAVQRADGPRAVQAMRQLRALHAAARSTRS